MLCVGRLDVIVLDVTYMFPVSMIYISACLSYVWHFTCITSEFVNSAHVVVLVFIERLWFCILLYCFCVLECNVYVGIFDEFGEFSNFWTVVCEGCPFFRLYPVFGGLFVVSFVLSDLLWNALGSYCFVPWFLLCSILFAVFVLLVVVIEFCWCGIGLCSVGWLDR